MPKHDFNLANELFDSFASRQQPESFMEALMVALPLQDVEESSEERLLLREAVYDAIEALPEFYREIVHLLTYEDYSLSELGESIGFTKTHAFRLRNVAYARLKANLEMNVHIRRKFGMTKTWDQSAAQWCTFLGSIAPDANKLDYEEVRDRIDAIIGTVFHNHQEPSQGMFQAVAKPVIEYLRKMQQWDSGKMAHLLSSKQHDYGHKNIDRFGIQGIVVRLNDKYERLANLEFTRQFAAKGNTILPRVNESKIDTLMDIVGYCVIGLMVLDDTFRLELSEDYDSGATNHLGV